MTGHYNTFFIILSLSKNTWRRDLEKEMSTSGFRYSWRKMEAKQQQHKTELDGDIK